MNAVWVKYLPELLRLKLSQRHSLQLVIGNSGWLLADKIVRGGVGLIVTVGVARYLGPEAFGLLNFSVAFVALFGAAVTFGLDGIVVRELVRQPEKKNELLGTAFCLKLLGGGAAFVLALFIIWHMRPGDTQAHWLVSIIAVGMLFQAIDVADLWFQSQVQSRATVIAKDTAFFIFSLLKLWLIWIHADIVAFAWASTGEIMLGSIGLILMFRATGNSWRYIRPVRQRMTGLLTESWPQILAGLTIMLHSKIDQVMLAQLQGEREVGLYSAAVRLSEIWNFVPAIIVSSVMPTLTTCRAQSRALYYRRLQQLYTLLARIAYGIAILTTCLAGPVIRLLYGDLYSSAALILSVHIWSSVFVFLGIATTPWSLNESTMKITLVQALLGAMLNICLNLYLIPIYGALGCAISTFVSYGFCAWLLNGCFATTHVIFHMQTRALLAR
jgi:PST family polysaccharide transporter